MKEERLAILKMVDDGKISADDAVKLLAAISSSKKGFDSGELQSSLEEKIKVFAKNMDTMGKEIGKKLEEVGKDMEPTLKKVAQTLVDKTTECVDEISKAFKKDECACEECKEEAENCCCEEKETAGDAENCCCEEKEETGDAAENAGEGCDCGCGCEEPHEN